MSGFVFVMGECVACRRLITFNPELVPSIAVKGVRQPVCLACVRRWEQLHGRTMVVHPEAYEPSDA